MSEILTEKSRLGMTLLKYNRTILLGLLSNVHPFVQEVGCLGQQRALYLLGFLMDFHSKYQLKALLIPRGHRDTCGTNRFCRTPERSMFFFFILNGFM